MAELLTDIAGSVLYFHDMEPIRIRAASGTPLAISLRSESSGLLVDESYYPDFTGEIEIDLSDVVATCLSHIVPDSYADTPQSRLYDNFTLTYGDQTATFTICGFSEDIKTRITDIDMLYVPETYILPLTLCNNVVRSGITYRFPDGTSKTEDGLATTASIGAVSRFIDISQSPAAGKDRFYVELDCGDTVISSPVLRVHPGHFEQYLFANRYGGFDNIPMAGELQFAPEFTFESGHFNGGNEQVDATADYVYTQNSGFVTQKTMELASELLCSGEIYHLTSEGEFRKIVIESSDLTRKSNDSLHSFSFKFKYADDSRPASLKGRQSVSYSSGQAVAKTLVYPVLESPMTIKHNLGRYPSVTVIDSDRQVVMTSVEYPNANSVTISWIGELSGFVYIN